MRSLAEMVNVTERAKGKLKELLGDRG
jgi:hypothetical protein